MSENNNRSPFMIPDVYVALARFARTVKQDRESKDHKDDFFGM